MELLNLSKLDTRPIIISSKLKVGCFAFLQRLTKGFVRFKCTRCGLHPTVKDPAVKNRHNELKKVDSDDVKGQFYSLTSDVRASNDVLKAALSLETWKSVVKHQLAFTVSTFYLIQRASIDGEIPVNALCPILRPL